MSKRKINFRIVENYKEDVDLDEMAKDYANPEVSIQELCDKHGISRNKYYGFKEELVKRTGLEPKPTLWGGRGKNQFCHIYKNGNYYKIAKTLNGKTVHFGQYTSLDEAVLIRDELIAHDWDFDYFSRTIKKRYFKNRDDPWMQTFEEFKKDYLDGMSVRDLMKKYGLSKYRYYSLSATLRHEYGLSRKPRVLVR